MSVSLDKEDTKIISTFSFLTLILMLHLQFPHRNRCGIKLTTKAAWKNKSSKMPRP